ncbi:MAG: glycosyltransferase [Chthoniobacteraceae bacterium]|nr:glycosyltransferase [Chthoniobacteraceae bacterium]
MPPIEPSIQAAREPLPCPSRRVAIVHDWLPLYGGAERVLEQILHLFPQADLFTLMEALPPGDRAFLHGKEPHTSLIQRLPFCAKAYRNYFALMPFAIEQFDLSAYDIVISSSYAFAKGVLTGPDQLHLCYCHSPIRYAWDLQSQYLGQRGGLARLIARLLLHYIRLWDTRTANGVDTFLANSHFIARRIRKTYGREARVVYPPVDVDGFTPRSDKDEYYLAASRFVPYKRLDIVVKAFAKMPRRKLVIIGDGPEFARIRSLATPNVTLAGHQSQENLRHYLERARGFVFAGEEDFGITLVEAQACATPVIAYNHGGAREIVRDGATGILFPEQNEESLIRAIRRFEALRFDPGDLRRNAERFSIQVFRCQFADAVESAYAQLAACL